MTNNIHNYLNRCPVETLCRVIIAPGAQVGVSTKRSAAKALSTLCDALPTAQRLVRVNQEFEKAVKDTVASRIIGTSDGDGILLTYLRGFLKLYNV